LFSTTIQSKIQDYSNSFYAAAQSCPQVMGHLDSGARMLATEVNNYIDSVREGVEFEESGVKKTLEKVWDWSEHAQCLDNDSTVKVLKKLAFSVIISLPTTFFIKDIQVKAEIHLSDANSVSDLGWRVARKIVYVTVALYFLDRLCTLATQAQEDADNVETTSLEKLTGLEFKSATKD
jgi:hypothetical protein